MKLYVLDTSALFTYFENEEGVEEMEALFIEALSGEIELLTSVVCMIEVFYISWQEQGEQIARGRMDLLADLPIRQVLVGIESVEVIAKIKVAKRMSFADCCIAGLAIAHNATLVHKDPEYEQVMSDVDLKALPYKR